MISRGGALEPRIAQPPLHTSMACGWPHVRLERHRLAGPAESSGNIEGFQVCCNLSGPVPLEWLVNGRWLARTLNAGDVCLATQGELRSVAWRQPYDLLLLAISPTLIAEVSDAHNQPMELEVQRGLRDRKIEALCKLMLADSTEGAPLGPAFGEQLGCALAVYLVKRFGLTKPRPVSCSGGLPGLVLRRVSDLIEAQLINPIRLQDLAREANISQFHFSRLFRNSTGESPYRYVLKRRIERVKSLTASGWSETDAAAAVGFSSVSQLASTFRRGTGMTPTQFRSLLRK